MLATVFSGLLPWLRRAMPLAVACAASLLLHGVVPWWGRGHVVPEPARVSLDLIAEVPPPLVAQSDPAPSEEPPPAPAPPAPAEPAEPAPATPPARQARQRNQPKPRPSPPAEADLPAAGPAAGPPDAALPAPPERAAPFPREPTQPLDLRGLRARAARDLAKRRRGRGQARGEAERAGAGGDASTQGEGKTPPPPAGARHERDPQALYACTPTGLGPRVEVRQQRPLTDWVTVVPTVLMPFPARPSLPDYLKGVAQVMVRGNRKEVPRAGPAEFALPAEVLQLEVERPRRARVALGRLEGRCLVGLRYTRQLFPFTLQRVPLRVIIEGKPAVQTLADITLFQDGTFELVRLEGDRLPFRAGSLKNANDIRSTIEAHYSAVRMVQQVASWFGVDLAEAAREERAKKRNREMEERRAARRRERDLARQSRR